MKVARHALAIARLEGEGTADEKARVKAWDRLARMLSTLDSKTSVLLRFNAIVVAALAYLVIVSATEPFAKANAIVKIVGMVVGHVSLLASVVSCGFAFPVINVEWNFFGGRLDHKDDSQARFDDAALERLGELVTTRTRLYSRAWQLAVAGGVGFAIMVALATIHIP
jgi:hypothetical protein